ncbi:MAG: ribosomal protein S19 family protein, partial [Trueperaceae bacterium]|nr:ribosomal protein S19 family protein [Trueperaceae bacterium]
MSRSLKKGPFTEPKLLEKVKKAGPGSKAIIKTWYRS